ncbi:MAG: peptidylprolyl isomerase [Bacteroidales bacterium]|jgi:peptidyl-prolyl cis-trans isomerase SurA|nr:peptidylprolyl isomerase [Bacteroidales bacterium]
MKKHIVFVLFFVVCMGSIAQNNKNVIDEIIATVGSRIITRSDLEYAFQGFKYSSGFMTMENEEQVRCDILEQLIFQKLLIDQAELDSITVTDAQINERIDYNLRYQIMQIGGDAKKLEQYYGKTIAEIKADSREQMRDEYLSEEMQKKLTADLNIINQEVKDYFNTIPQDSIPLIPVEYEIAQIVKTPVISETEKITIKQNLENIRDRVLRGENFSTFARMYSEDPGSAIKGGELGFTNRGDLYPEFEAAAYNLKTGEISSVVETKAGYHIIQMLERRGERINVAHILIKPKPSPDAMMNAKNFLDSVYNLLTTNHLSFDSATLLFSDDPGKINGGMIVNPFTSSYSFQEEQLNQYDKTILYVIEDMIPGDYTRTISMINENGNQAYRILYLKAKRAEHKANLVDDYEKIKNAASEAKKQKTLLQWAKNKNKYTHVKINPEFHDCPFVEEWEMKF